MPVFQQLADRKELSPSVVTELRKIYSGTQPITTWNVVGPLARDNHAQIDAEKEIDLAEIASKKRAEAKRRQALLNGVYAGLLAHLNPTTQTP